LGERRMDVRLLGGSLFLTCTLMTQALWAAAIHSGDSLPNLPERPVIKAAALYLIELNTRRILLDKNATQRLPPASLTKIMSALVALGAGPLQEVGKIDRRAIVHHSSYHFRAGEVFLLRDLVTA